MNALERRSRMGLAVLAAALLSVSSPALAIDDVLLRHIETALDFVGFTAVNCAQHYDDQIKPEARAKLNFSPEDIATYCVCSTKLLIRQMDEKDFETLEARRDLPETLEMAMKQAHFDCAKKIWDARRQR